jgi:pyroglutamyl-peptidase
MPNQLLVTSFDTWLAEQTSNASDDLLTELLQRGAIGNNSYLLRRLPVDTAIAAQQVIAHIESLQPDIVLCCGMASDRGCLSLESTGRNQDCSDCCTTTLDLERLSDGLSLVEISHDAGSFVCNGLYYTVLTYLRDRSSLATRSSPRQQPIHALFLHVPVLTPGNTESIIADCSILFQRLSFNDWDRSVPSGKA